MTRPTRQQIKSNNGVNQIHDEEVDSYIKNARMLAERAVPSFISALRVCTDIITEDIPTAAIDKYWRVYWNPDMVRFLIMQARAVSDKNPCPSCGATQHHDLAYIAGTWIHEAGHQVFKHSERYEECNFTDPHKWNVCTDAEMDDDIPEIGKAAAKWVADKGGLLPAICYDKWAWVNEEQVKVARNSKEYWAAHKPWDKNFSDPAYKKVAVGMFPEHIKNPEGWIAENYYTNYPPEMENPPGAKIILTVKPGSAPSGEGIPGLPFPMMADIVVGAPEHGSGVTGEQKPWEDGEPGQDKPGGGKNAPGISASEGAAVRRDVAQAIKAEKQKGRGHIPGGWDVFADAILAPAKIRWQDVLRAMARQALARVAGERHTSYRRLSRSSIVSGMRVIKPSTFDILPVVTVVLDTSGSMGSGRNSRLEAALCEVEGILSSNKVKSYFIDCDANIYGDAQSVKSVKNARISGGGGTDMRVGVRAARKQRVKPDIIVVITDGDTPWPEPQDVQGVKIITAICNKSGIGDCPAWMNPIWVNE